MIGKWFYKSLSLCFQLQEGFKKGLETHIEDYKGSSKVPDSYVDKLQEKVSYCRMERMAEVHSEIFLVIKPRDPQ